MKELFNILSNVSNFLSGKRFIYQNEAPKPPEAQNPAEVRKEQAKLQDIYLQPQEAKVLKKDETVAARAGEKYKLMRVRENVGAIPRPDQMFGPEVPVFKINEKSLALRNKENGKYYEPGTEKPKKEIVLKPGDRLEFPTDPDKFGEMMRAAMVLEGTNVVIGGRIEPGPGHEQKPGKPVDAATIAAQRRTDLDEQARRMPGVKPTKPEKPTPQVAQAKPEESEVGKPFGVRFKYEGPGANVQVVTDEQIKDTKKYPYVVYYEYRTDEPLSNEPKIISLKTIAVKNTPNGLIDANGKLVTRKGEYKLLVPFDGDKGETMREYIAANVEGRTKPRPETAEDRRLARLERQMQKPEAARAVAETKGVPPAPETGEIIARRTLRRERKQPRLK